ncbi:hypothetical protein AB1Y20_017153 [Prymnesium parvum]|uniref:ACB domain-containing protein n=1 Tax=Prymnesium parvum TaxID=97485 RepID=A0AB34IBQ0_PRYPA
MSVSRRFESALHIARTLPPSLLSKDQKLKLFALFKQAEAPAPAAPPADASELEIAKWEAWNDVRSLTQEQAMRSYAMVIEGLLEMLKEHAPPAAAAEEEEEEEEGEGEGEEEGGEEEEEEDDDDDEEEETAAEEEKEPAVEATVWSTSSLSLSAGSTFDVPLTVAEPSLVSYAFSLVGGAGPIGFTLRGEAGPLVEASDSSAEGKAEAPAGMLHAVLDNSASTFMSVTVKCQVSLEPLSQLKKREAFRNRVELQKMLRTTVRSLEAETQHLADLSALKAQLSSRLSDLIAQAEEARADLATAAAEVDAADARRARLSARVAELWQLLQQR